MKILLTGAFSNTGQVLVPFLLKKGLHVVATDVKTAQTQQLAKIMQKNVQDLNATLEIVWCDLTERDAFTQLSSKAPFAAIVHMAFIIPPFTDLFPERAEKVNINGTENIIAFAQTHSPSARFIFCSSTTVFGKQRAVDEMVTLDHEINATSRYTEHKIMCEEKVKNAGLDWAILRFSAILNPHFRPDRESLRFALTISLKTHFEFVHVLDLAQAMYNAITLPSLPQRTFIIAGGEPCRMLYRDYVYTAINAFAGNVSEEDIPWGNYADTPYYLYWYDTESSQRVLQFQSHTVNDFIEEAPKYTKWYEKILLKLFKKQTLKFYFSA